MPDNKGMAIRYFGTFAIACWLLVALAVFVLHFIAPGLMKVCSHMPIR